jgi:hypothetical protein
MSNISDAFDAIKTLLETTFPTHKQLSNPYEVPENTTAALMKGWGLALGPGTNTNRNLSCHLSVGRTISIPITRTRHGSSLITAKNETNEKLLLEDQYLLIKAMEKDPTVNDNETITKMIFVGDDGIESVLSDNDHFITIVSRFELEYFEDLNS